MLFTNLSYLSSSLQISIEDNKEKVINIFYYCYKLMKWFKEHESLRLEPILIKKFGKLIEKMTKETKIEG